MKRITKTPGAAAPDDSSFRVEVSENGQEICVSLYGELDLTVIDEVARALSSAEYDGRPVAVDLRELSFMDLSGLRLLLDTHRRLGERLTLRGCSPQLRRLFELTGTDEQLPLLD